MLDRQHKKKNNRDISKSLIDIICILGFQEQT